MKMLLGRILLRRWKPMIIPIIMMMANNKGSQTCSFFIRAFYLKCPEGCKLMNHKLNCRPKARGIAKRLYRTGAFGAWRANVDPSGTTTKRERRLGAGRTRDAGSTKLGGTVLIKSQAMNILIADSGATKCE